MSFPPQTTAIPPSLARIIFHLGTHTYTALLPAPSHAVILNPSPSSPPKTLTLSAGALTLPGGSISLATNGIVTMPSSSPSTTEGLVQTTITAKVATISLGTRVVTAIVTGMPTGGIAGGEGRWVVEGNTIVTSGSVGVVVKSAGGGGSRTVGWGSTTVVRGVVETKAVDGKEEEEGEGKGGRYLVGTRVYESGGRVAVGDVKSTMTGSAGEESGGVGGGEEMKTTTKMVTTTERETTTATATVTVMPTRTTGRGGRMEVKRKMVGLGLAVSVLVGVVCW